MSAIFLLLNIKNFPPYLKDWLKIILKPQIIIFFIFAILFLLFIYTPTYLDSEAVGTAVGGPSKETRAGLTFNQLKTTAGEARMVFGLIGIVILLAIKKRKSYENVFVLGWTIAILIMSLKPQWLFLDLPSTRIANYISFPLAISAFAWFDLERSTFRGKMLPKPKNVLRSLLYALCFYVSQWIL